MFYKMGESQTYRDRVIQRESDRDREIKINCQLERVIQHIETQKENEQRGRETDIQRENEKANQRNTKK